MNCTVYDSMKAEVSVTTTRYEAYAGMVKNIQQGHTHAELWSKQLTKFFPFSFSITAPSQGAPYGRG